MERCDEVPAGRPEEKLGYTQQTELAGHLGPKDDVSSGITLRVTRRFPFHKLEATSVEVPVLFQNVV